MLRRETGWGLDEGARDIWMKQIDPLGRFR